MTTRESGTVTTAEGQAQHIREPRTERWVDLGIVGTLVEGRVRQLQEGALSKRSASVAMLAHLRHAVGKQPGSVPDVWPVTLADELAGPDAGDGPTAGETAAHIALTLYAIHQQSSSKPMHRRGYGLGRSISELRPSESDTDPVLRRFQAVGTADSLDELIHHTRGLVQLLRAAGIPLDYGLLADELFRWQQDGGASRVRLQWGRDFYRTPRHADDSDTPAPTPQPAGPAQ
jgi:CRISPR system Cascade subunit CasB